MSQYHSPYQPPTPAPMPAGYPPMEAAIGPARRAGMLMWIVGVLLTLFGFCNAVSSIVTPAQEMYNRQMQMFPSQQQSPIGPDALRAMSIVMAVVIFTVGITFILLGTFVRAGRRGAIIAAACVSGVLAVLMIGAFLMALLAMIAAPIAGVCACGTTIPLGLMSLLLFWLIQAARGSSQLRRCRTPTPSSTGNTRISSRCISNNSSRCRHRVRHKPPSKILRRVLHRAIRMALPPPNDPNRPKKLAVRSMLLVGGLMFGLSIAAIPPIFLYVRSVQPGVTRPARLLMLFPFLPGLGLCVLSLAVARSQKWAVILAMLLAGAGGMFAILTAARILIAMSQGNMPLGILFPLGLTLLTIAAIVHLIYLLIRSYAAMRYSPEQRGFAPIMTTPKDSRDADDR